MATIESMEVEIAVKRVSLRWFGLHLGRLFLGLVRTVPQPDESGDSTPEEARMSETTNHGLRVVRCRGHYHVAGGEGEETYDLALLGDPFRTEAEAQAALDLYVAGATNVASPVPSRPPEWGEPRINQGEYLEGFLRAACGCSVSVMDEITTLTTCGWQHRTTDLLGGEAILRAAMKGESR